MGKKSYDITKRLKFLAERFNVFDQDEGYEAELETFSDYDYTSDIRNRGIF